MRLIEKRTVDLKAGDVVHFADLVDTVTSVLLPRDGCVVVKVWVMRNGLPTSWHAGINSVQDVEVPS